YSAQNMVNMTERQGAAMERGSRLDEIKAGQARITVPSPLNSDQTRDIITASGNAAVERIKALDEASKQGNDADYPNGSLSSQLAAIARVIKANVGLEVAQAGYGGWDHHSDEGGAGGRQAGMAGHLAACISAF